jgi:hypothetical protein
MASDSAFDRAGSSRQGGTMPDSSNSRDENSTSTPSPEIQRLGALVGRWRSEGHVVADPPVPITGDDGSSWQLWMDMTFTRMA